jgi:myosin VIIa
MKKLWINTVPGKDENADHIFYFPQELPKYLRGYHKSDKTTAVTLAAYIYRAKFGVDRSFLLGPGFEVQMFVPADIIRLQSTSEWRKQILLAYNKNEGMTSEDAMNAFLRIISDWSTFGTAFFDVKQSTDSSLPEIIIIGINKNGVNVIHPQRKVYHFDK